MICAAWSGWLMGFGAGTLLAAVSYELVFVAMRRSPGSGASAIGFFAGANGAGDHPRWDS